MSLLLLVAKTSVVLLAALGATALLRRSAASTRHRVWSVAFALLLAVPALAFVMPALKVPMPAITPQPAAMKGNEGQSSFSFSKNIALPDSPSVSPEAEGLPKEESLHGPSLPFMAEIVWAVGFVVALATLGLSLFRVRRLSRDSEELTDTDWQLSASAISARLGLSPAPRLVVSERVSSPMAGGVSRPTVFLPASAHGWDAEQRDVVLTHEIAHLASRDPLRHIVVRLAVACYWFHPLAWLAAHRATVSREQACDEAVLAAGTRPSAYARVLLDLAESLGPGGAPLTALPMAQRSNLEKRVMTILNNDARSTSTRGSLTAAVCLAVVTLSVAAARPSAAIVEIVAAAPAAVTKLAEDAKEQPTSQSRVFAGTTDACRWNDDRSFSGTTDNSRFGVTTRVGQSNSQAIVQRSFDGLRVCMVAEGLADRVDRPAQMMDRASRVSMSSERGGETHQLDIVRTGGSPRTTWRVNGKERAVDAAAEEWRRSMLAVLDNTWETSQLHGQVSSLRGEISSVHGQESSLHGEISSLRGEVSSMNGEISSLYGHESSLRGQISSIQGQLSSLRGEISSEQGAISSLNARRYDASTAEERRIQSMIDGHRKRIQEVEKEIAGFDAEGKIREVQKAIDRLNTAAEVRELQKKIETFALEDKVREVRKNLDNLKVDDKVRELQKQIVELNADDRIRVLEGQQAEALKRLRAAIAAIR